MGSEAISVSAKDRLAFLYDEGEFTELDALAKSNENLSGVITAYGYVNSNPVYAFSQDTAVNDGALSVAQATKIKKLYEMAAKTGIPVVGIYDSFGADLKDGLSAMNSYGELLMWTSNLSGVVPQISVIAGTCAGAFAMMAVSADFVIADKSAELFITPNIASDGLMSAAAKNGTVCAVEDDIQSAIEKAKELLARLPQNNLAPVPLFEFEEPMSVSYDNADEFAKSICDNDSVTELYSDYGCASYTALGSICGASVGICATNKSKAKLNADDCNKISRFVRTCDAFAIPVITLVDTEGFDTEKESNASGSVLQMAKLASAYAEATTIKISVVIGKAYGPAFIALAGKGSNADLTFAVKGCAISAVDPLTAAEFLYHDKLKGASDLDAQRQKLADEYAENEASAEAAAAKMCVDGVIAFDEIRSSLANAIEIMAGKRISRLPKKHNNSPF